MEYFKDKENINDKNDPLMPLYNRTFNLINYKIFNFITFLTFCIFTSTNLIYFYNVVASFDAHLLIQYGPLKFILLSGISSSLIYWKVNKPFVKLRNKLISHCWSVSSINDETAQRILTESKYLNLYQLLNGILAVIIGIYHTPLVTSEKHIFFAIDFFKNELPPRIGQCLVLLYYCTTPVLCYMCFINTYLVTYPLHHLKFQKMLLSSLIKNISSDYSIHGEIKLIQNENYQLMISKRLKICIKHHILIKKFEKEVNDLSYMPILIVFSLGVVIIISIISNIVMVPDTNYYRLGLTFFGAIIGFYAFLYSGQSSIDESINLYENAKKCYWTGWNSKNQKLFLIFLINLKKTPIIGIPGILLCEYQYLIGVMQLIGSFSTFIMQIVSNRT